jgi:hypothetical protein
MPRVGRASKQADADFLSVATIGPIKKGPIFAEIKEDRLRNRG